jgi:hypothetical protein
MINHHGGTIREFKFGVETIKGNHVVAIGNGGVTVFWGNTIYRISRNHVTDIVYKLLNFVNHGGYVSRVDDFVNDFVRVENHVGFVVVFILYGV